MTCVSPTAPTPPAAPRIVSRPFLLLLVSTFGSFCGFSMALPLIPAWAVSGGAGEAGAGSTTLTLMVTTVAVQPLVPALLRRYGRRIVLGLGGVLLGAPSLLYGLSSDLGPLVAVSAVRGLGFGIVAVTGSALAGELVDARIRARAVGAYGLAVGLPQVVFMPVGVWVAERAGYLPLFVFLTLAPLAGVVAAARLPEAAGVTPAGGLRAYGGVGRLMRLFGPAWLVMFAVDFAVGLVVTFLPLVVGGALGGTALAGYGAAALGARWVAGVAGDRLPPGRMLVPATLAGVVGLAGLAVVIASGAPGLAVAFAVVFGASFGVVQNDTLMVMFARTRDGMGTASAVWNIANDAGLGIGALALGAVAEGLGFPAAFAGAALVMALTLPAAWWSTASLRSGRRRETDR